MIIAIALRLCLSWKQAIAVYWRSCYSLSYSGSSYDCTTLGYAANMPADSAD